MIEDSDYFKGISETIQMDLDSNVFLTVKELGEVLLAMRLALSGEAQHEIRWVDPLTFDEGCG